MISEALFIMDKNAERLMVDELQEQFTSANLSTQDYAFLDADYLTLTCRIQSA